MNFNLAEKLAIVKVIDSVIHADGIVHNGEIDILSKLMYIIDFDSNFLIYSRNIDIEQGTLIMNSMPIDKKKKVKEILEQVAISDGFVHEKEKQLLSKLYSSIGISE